MVIFRIVVLLLLLLAQAHASQGGATSSNPDNTAQPASLPAWMGNVRLAGIFETDFAWMAKGDAADRNSGAVSDLFIGTVALGVGVDVTDRLAGNIVFLAEDIGTVDETGVNVDEATMTFHEEDSPFSLVVGKRVQPFGVFENHLVADPMTQDAYETNRPGVTVMYSGPMDLGLSATVYRGEEMMTHLFESELFDAEAIARVEHLEPEEVSSYILSVSIKPMSGPLTFFGSFLSEPGAGDRNDTASVGIHYEPDGMKGFRVDGEYMKAVGRERYAGFDREFKEGVVSVTVAYEFVLRKREVVGGSLFAEKRGHIVAEPLEIAVRYEHFDDDGMADASQSSSVKDRYGAGARYTFHQDPARGLAVYLGGEYRHTEYRVHPSRAEIRADSNEEFFARLGLAF